MCVCVRRVECVCVYSVMLHLSLHLCCDRVQIPLGHRKKRVEEMEEEILCLGAGM